MGILISTKPMVNLVSTKPTLNFEERETELNNRISNLELLNAELKNKITEKELIGSVQAHAQAILIIELIKQGNEKLYKNFFEQYRYLSNLA